MLDQLKMWWNKQEISSIELPRGFKVRRFGGSDSDIDLWIGITKNGLLPDDATKDNFIEAMVNYPYLDTGNIIFIEDNGYGVATITPVIQENKMGYIHMVACRPEYRGMGLGNVLNNIALKFLYDAGCNNAYLTTDDFRLPAIKSYITAGLLPVLYNDADEMESRWLNVLSELNIDRISAVDNAGNFVKEILRSV